MPTRPRRAGSRSALPGPCGSSVVSCPSSVFARADFPRAARRSEEHTSWVFSARGSAGGECLSGVSGVAGRHRTRLNDAMPEAPPDPAAPTIVALVRDLMFSTRIRGMAKDLGVSLSLHRDGSHLIAAGGSRLLVDLN